MPSRAADVESRCTRSAVATVDAWHTRATLGNIPPGALSHTNYTDVVYMQLVLPGRWRTRVSKGYTPKWLAVACLLR